ncbi:hypothetical protein BGZ58_005782, partial [Dissophora ornata]
SSPTTTISTAWIPHTRPSRTLCLSRRATRCTNRGICLRCSSRTRILRGAYLSHSWFASLSH